MWKVFAKWTLLIAMAILALSGCAKNAAPFREFGSSLGYCDENVQLGRFDISLARSKEYPDYYELVLNTVLAVQPGLAVRVSLVNKNQNYKDLVPFARMNQGEDLSRSFVSRIELQTFQTVVVAPYDGGNTTIVNSRDPRATLCQIPTIDPVNGQQAGSVPSPDGSSGGSFK